MDELDLSRVTIRPLNDHDSLEQLTGLLHRAYKSLAELGLRYVATYQTVDITRRRVSKGICFVAECDGKLIGTIMYNPDQFTGLWSWYEREGVAKISQLGVEPSWQGRGLGRMLVEAAETRAREDGAKELALDTAEPATHLIDWYGRMGYRLVGHADWEVTNYRSVIMSKKL